MFESYNKHRELYASLDQSVKLGDVASIVSLMLDMPFPFSNMGNMHPIFAQTNDLKKVH